MFTSSQAFLLRGALLTSGTVVCEHAPLFIISKDDNGGSRLTVSLAHPCLSASRELRPPQHHHLTDEL